MAVEAYPTPRELVEATYTDIGYLEDVIGVDQAFGLYQELHKSGVYDPDRWADLPDWWDGAAEMEMEIDAYDAGG